MHSWVSSKVLNLRALTLSSRLALIIRVWLTCVLPSISNSSEFAGIGSAVEVGFYGLYQNGFLKVANLQVLAPLSRLALTLVAWLVSAWISKVFEFAGIGSAVEVGFDYRILACIRMDFYKI